MVLCHCLRRHPLNTHFLCVCVYDFMVWFETWDDWKHEAIEDVKWTAVGGGGGGGVVLIWPVDWIGAWFGESRQKRWHKVSQWCVVRWEKPTQIRGGTVKLVRVGHTEQERSRSRCLHGEFPWEKFRWWYDIPQCIRFNAPNIRSL